MDTTRSPIGGRVGGGGGGGGGGEGEGEAPTRRDKGKATQSGQV